MSAVSRNWVAQTYKTLGAQPAKFYTLWVLFFTAASALYGYGYYLLLPYTRVLLVLSPLGIIQHRRLLKPAPSSGETHFFSKGLVELLFIYCLIGICISYFAPMAAFETCLIGLVILGVAWFFEKRLRVEDEDLEYTRVIAFILFYALLVLFSFRLVAYIASLWDADFLLRQKALEHFGFYFLPTLFCVGWLFAGHNLFSRMRRAIEQEWWLKIKFEGEVPSRDDIQVGNAYIDVYLKILGEPRTWWEQRLQEPEGRSFLADCRNQGYFAKDVFQDGVFAMTAHQISRCADSYKEQAEKWRNALKKSPPTPQDWKDSGFDFSTSAQDKAAATSQRGAPIAVPSIRNDSSD